MPHGRRKWRPPRSCSPSPTLGSTGRRAHAQATSVTLNNVSYGVGTGNIIVDRVVNAGDSTQTRNRSGSLTDGATFRSDVNLDGVVNSGDASIVRGASGTGLGGFEIAGEKQK